MLQKLNFLPGFNKQLTPTQAEGQWVDGDNVRFRYNTPEKIGGWLQLGENDMTGAARAMHHVVNKSGNKFSIIGTNRILYAYTGGVFYDIHPIRATSTLSSCFTTTNGSAVVSIAFSGDHGLVAGDIILLDNFTTITNSNYTASDFDDKKFMVTSVENSSTIKITMPSNETGSGAANSGGIRVQAYYNVGPAEQKPGLGYGLGQWSGTVSGEAVTSLSGGINAVTTTVVLSDASLFPSSGTKFVQIGSEEISYTGITGNTLTGVTRGVRNTTAATHSNGATVTNSSDYVAWGEEASGDLVIDPGMWSIDNFGDKIIALIHNAQVFEWNSNAANAVATRATIISGAPTASRDMLVSTPDRHLVFYGTETTIGDPSTQDDMFIRFSDQENINDYTPTATNTAGTQRLADGSRIVGAVRGRDAIYVWTDTSLFTMRFIGPPFTFGFAQVGTNCGLIGQNAAIEVDGAAYWLSENGFFKYSGNLETMICLVEDYVYDDINTTKGQQVFAGINNLYTEVIWWYPSANSDYNDRYVVYNYADKVWYTGTEPRTSWVDAEIYNKPFGTKFTESGTGTFPEVIGESGLGKSQLFEHEIGTNQVDENGTPTTITSFIKSFDFDLQQQGGVAGEVFLAVRRFVPDFESLTGDATITLNIKRYPQQSDSESTLSPFTIDSSTDKKDTRARGRFVNLKIENKDLNQSWRFGTFRLDIQPDGRR